MTKTAIVTGAAGGIGQALCTRFSDDGFRVVGLDLVECSRADVFLSVNLADQDAIRAALRPIVDQEDIAVVVHNAACQPLGGVGTVATANLLATLSVNVVAVDTIVGCVRASLEVNRGAVVAISSVHAAATTGGIGAYASSKAALEGWVRAAALDLAPKVRVNGVRPGAVDTAKLRQGFARWGAEAEIERRAVLESRTPLGRIGKPEDVAAAVAFLASGEAAFITGTVLTVDGGALAVLGTE